MIAAKSPPRKAAISPGRKQKQSKTPPADSPPRFAKKYLLIKDFMEVEFRNEIAILRDMLLSINYSRTEPYYIVERGQIIRY